MVYIEGQAPYTFQSDSSKKEKHLFIHSQLSLQVSKTNAQRYTLDDRLTIFPFLRRGRRDNEKSEGNIGGLQKNIHRFWN